MPSGRMASSVRTVSISDSPFFRLDASACKFMVSAPSREAVDAFHAAALANGGIDNGKPGIRSQYHANYYAAFVFDPDGHKIEAVRHPPE